MNFWYCTLFIIICILFYFPAIFIPIIFDVTHNFVILHIVVIIFPYLFYVERVANVPLFKTKPSRKMSYSSEIWYGSSFYDVYQGSVEKQRWNRRKPPSATEIFLSFLAELDLSEKREIFLSNQKSNEIFLSIKKLRKFF